MEQERKPVEIRIGTTPERGHEFLRLLAEDDEFRSRLAREPLTVLAEYDIELSEGALPESIELPPREHVAELLGRMGEMDEYGNFNVQTLGWGFFVVVLGFAMPLVPEDEG
jgi:hypothetical protein